MKNEKTKLIILGFGALLSACKIEHTISKESVESAVLAFNEAQDSITKSKLKKEKTKAEKSEILSSIIDKLDTVDPKDNKHYFCLNVKNTTSNMTFLGFKGKVQFQDQFNEVVLEKDITYVPSSTSSIRVGEAAIICWASPDYLVRYINLAPRLPITSVKLLLDKVITSSEVITID